ncbi:MAG TPA: transcription antitermination factor NusB [Chitinophagaceae bacterium]|nr:transcription antitermination factor NusB [Chitinophagaceae bacterium]
MLSRRNIRVKVMQTLYSIESMNNETRPGEPLQILKKKLEHTQQLFTYLVYYIIEVARFAEKDAAQKSQKHLPSAYDLNINTRISGNEVVWAILENKSFQKSLDQLKIKYLINEDLIKKCYLALIASPEYKEYITGGSRDKKSEKKILEFIFDDLMLPDDHFISDVEEKFIHWDDDVDMMIVLMSSLLQKPAAFNFLELTGKEKMDFAINLLECVIDKKEYCRELIKPKLNNWDAERIASLDMIFMEMGVCEFLYFETIPTKVTINEYIDLAKEYSTEQSGHFVNGILDNIHKELLSGDKIHKKNFKNSVL